MSGRSGLARILHTRRSLGTRATVREVLSYVRWRLSPGKPATVPWVTIDDWFAAYRRLSSDVIGPSDRVSFSIVCGIQPDRATAAAQLVESLLEQTHLRWDLTLVLPKTSEHADPPDEVRAIRSRDRRIRIVEGTIDADSDVDVAVVAGLIGDYIILVDASDRLHPHALARIARCCPAADVVYTDEVVVAGVAEEPIPVFKPAWSPRLLLAEDYVGTPVAIRRSLVLEDGVASHASRCSRHSILLRLAERECIIAHVPFLAVRRGEIAASAEGSPTPWATGESDVIATVRGALARRGWSARAVIHEERPHACRVVFNRRTDAPRIKVIMPTRDAADLLETAATGVLERTAGVDVHLVIVDNRTSDSRALSFLEGVRHRASVTVLRADDDFNFSALCNAGSLQGPTTDYLLFLNNDIEIQHTDWLQQLSGWLIEDPAVVGVGPKLVFPDDRIQHAGVVLGFRGIAGHYALGQIDAYEPMSYHDLAREVSALTAACLLVRSSDFHAVGGFDESLPVDFQDVDLCLRLRRDLGGTLVADPTYPVVHAQSATRGPSQSPSMEAVARMRFLWGEQLEAGDPYYSPHLSMSLYDMSLRSVDAESVEFERRLSPRWFGLGNPDAGGSSPLPIAP